MKVDGGKVRFIYDGYRWRAPTPMVAKDALILFDKKKRHLIKPHRYKLKAERGSKVLPLTRERKDQINEARQRRLAEGRPDKVHDAKTVHQRVVGLAMGHG